MLTLGITIPARNRKSLTTAILQQLSAQIADQAAQANPSADLQSVNIQIIVVDDASTDGTAEAIRLHFPQVHLLAGDGGLWWTGAIAQAMIYATQTLNADYIIWLNDDITLANDFITQALAYCQQPTAKTLIGGIVCDQQHPNWIVFGGVIASQLINDISQFTQPVLPVDTLNGNLTILPACIIADIGLPDTSRFRHYGGDFEYICRAKANGYRVQLSSHLRATTDYPAADVIRYMPLWMQWAICSHLADKWQVLQKLSSRRSPHNVEHMVNSIHRAQPSVPRWRYAAFYCRKLIQIVGTELMPATLKKRRIQAYFQRQNIPPDIAQAILKTTLKPSL